MGVRWGIYWTEYVLRVFIGSYRCAITPNLCISAAVAGEKLLTSSHLTIPPSLQQHVTDLHNAQQKHSLIKPKHVHK